MTDHQDPTNNAPAGSFDQAAPDQATLDQNGPDRPAPDQPARAGGATVGSGELEPWVRALLRCPVSGDELTDDTAPDGTPELRSVAAGLAYPVRDGVPVLLRDEARDL
ncbi:MAG: Trm112 family protein [Actinomycetales bacterium]